MKKISLLFLTITIALLSKEIHLKQTQNTPQRVLPVSQNQILSYSSILEDPINSVVNISIDIGSDEPSPYAMQDPFLREYFGQQYGRGVPKNKLEHALGSGVIVSTDGYIVTNAHVVENASKISVSVHGDMTQYRANIIGKDKASDLAVIKIDANNLKPITIAKSDTLKVGDVVFAIGNPFGVGETVTQGIISALNKHSIGINKYEDFIQTDASINPGNSGGALVDSRGALIGINAAILSKSGGNHGIGFSIPSNMVTNIVAEIISKGKVERGFMGVSVSQILPKQKSRYKHKRGAVITSISANSAAQKAKLKRGDLIYTLNGKTITSPNSLQQAVAALDPGNKITIEIERDKQDIAIDMTLFAKKSVQNQNLDGGIIGMRLSYITPRYKHILHIPPDIKGLIVTQVEIGSVADSFGFEPGDVIMQVNQIKIHTIEEWYSSLRRHGHKEIFILRDGSIYLLTIQI